MANTSKTAVDFQTSASNAAGATATGSTIDLRTGFGCGVVGKVTNGATGPTLPCDCVYEVSVDGTNWEEIARASADLGNNVVTRFPFFFKKEWMYGRCKFLGNTGQAVTVECKGHHVSSIG